MHSLVFHIGKEWYFIMWMSTSACYTMRWVTNAIITVSLCITCLQLSFPSHTHWAQLHWTDLNCISIGSHEQRYQHGAHRLRFYSGKVKQLILNVWIIVIMLSAPSYAWISYPSKAQQTTEKNPIQSILVKRFRFLYVRIRQWMTFVAMRLHLCAFVVFNRITLYKHHTHKPTHAHNRAHIPQILFIVYNDYHICAFNTYFPIRMLITQCFSVTLVALFRFVAATNKNLRVFPSMKSSNGLSSYATAVIIGS